jgi:hypothetical protein
MFKIDVEIQKKDAEILKLKTDVDNQKKEVVTQV